VCVCVCVCVRVCVCAVLGGVSRRVFDVLLWCVLCVQARMRCTLPARAVRRAR